MQLFGESSKGYNCCGQTLCRGCNRDKGHNSRTPDETCGWLCKTTLTWGRLKGRVRVAGVLKDSLLVCLKGSLQEVILVLTLSSSHISIDLVFLTPLALTTAAQVAFWVWNKPMYWCQDYSTETYLRIPLWTWVIKHVLMKWHNYISALKKYFRPFKYFITINYMDCLPETIILGSSSFRAQKSCSSPIGKMLTCYIWHSF